MRYVNRILQPGEEIKHESRLHWIIYMPALFLFAICVIGLFLIASNQIDQIPPASIFIACMFLFGLMGLFQAWLKRRTTEIAVTNRRVIFKRGLIRRHTIEMNMDKVESVDVYQPMMGRILNYGSITVRGTGSGIEPLHKIESPIELRNFVTAR